MKLVIALLIIVVLTIWGIIYVKTTMEKGMEKYMEKIELIK